MRHRRRRGPTTTSSGPPAVLVVLEQPWHSMMQLAAGVRRQGLRAVHVGPTSSRDERVMVALVFGGTTTTADELVHGGDRPWTVLDAQGRDVDVAALALRAAEAPAPVPESAVLENAARLADKLEVSRLLAAHGVPVPAALPGDTDAGTAAEALGLPFFVKERVGAGGTGVHLAQDAAQAGDLVARLGADATFFEAAVDGETVQYCAAHAEGRVILDVVAHTARRIGTMPASELEVLDDAVVRDVGRATVAALRGRGLVNLDVLRTQDGGAYVVDVNARAWDSLVPLRRLGYDFVHAYAEALGVRPAGSTPVPPVTAGGRIRSFPGPLLGEAPHLGWFRLAGRATREAWPFLRWLGPRYVLHVAWLTALAKRSARSQA